MKVGNTVFQANSNAISFESVPNGTLVGFAGSLAIVGGTNTGAGQTGLTVTNAGIGYTPLGSSVPSGSTSYADFVNIPLTTVTGLGQNARGTATVENGQITRLAITSGGNGYTVGDVVTATLGDGAGEGLRATVGTLNIHSFNELVLTDVQGDFDTSASAYSLRYVDGTLGIGTVLNYVGSTASGTPVEVKPTSATVSDGDDGLHLKIRMKNHGMYNSINKVTLTDVESNLIPSSISQNYSRTSTSNLGVLVGSGYTTFEGLTVGAAQTGYIRIEDEIIGYTGVSGNTLTGISRGIDGTPQEQHDSGTQAYKYEFGGISLRRINKTHDLQNVTIANDPLGVDFYHVKIDPASDGVNRSSAQWDPTDASTKLPLKVRTLGKGGGPEARSTYNIPFSLMIPKFELLNPTGTNISARVRTVTGGTVNGNEPAFVDQGFTEVNMHEPNYFPSVRQVASTVNENAYLTSLPGNKSLSMLMDMTSSDRRLSPMVNLDHAAITFVNNRINKPIATYEDDFRVNGVIAVSYTHLTLPTILLV